MPIFRFLLLSLAAWRVASLFVKEDGPWNILARFRGAVGVRYDEFSKPYGTNVLASVLTCVWCFGVWVGLAASFFSPFTIDAVSYIVGSLAISTLIILIDKAVS